MLNLVEAWLLTIVSPEDWKEKYEPILSASYEYDRSRIEAASNWGDPDESGRGEFKLIRNDESKDIASNISFKTAAPPL